MNQPGDGERSRPSKLGSVEWSGEQPKDLHWKPMPNESSCSRHLFPGFTLQWMWCRMTRCWCGLHDRSSRSVNPSLSRAPMKQRWGFEPCRQAPARIRMHPDSHASSPSCQLSSMTCQPRAFRGDTTPPDPCPTPWQTLVNWISLGRNLAMLTVKKTQLHGPRPFYRPYFRFDRQCRLLLNLFVLCVVPLFLGL